MTELTRPRTVEDRISVCICTLKRERMLTRALQKAMAQETEGRFTLELVVVDNDRQRSAEELVTVLKDSCPVPLIYACEPEKNISLARNRAIQSAGGNLIAFIDDDEFPGNGWLLNLYQALEEYRAGGVLGPVKPHFENTPPRWLIPSGLCDRPSFPTGTGLGDSRYMRTGNVLIDRRILEGVDHPFDPRHGLTGGEDAHFFEDMVAKGYTFIWCDEAVVYEEVPRQRQELGYFLKRACIRGVTSAAQQPVLSLGTLKSLIALLLYTAALPLLLVRGFHLFARYLVKDCDHLAKLLAHCGIRLAKTRAF